MLLLLYKTPFSTILFFILLLFIHHNILFIFFQYFFNIFYSNLFILTNFLLYMPIIFSTKCSFYHCCFALFLFFLMILFFCIHIPNGFFIHIFIFQTFSCFDCCQHGMIHIIISMLPVSSNTE